MMRSVLGFVGLMAVGCGSVVIVDGDGGTAGTGGTGGAPIVPTNPAECPATAPMYYGDCAAADAVCTYLEESGCTVTYTCITDPGCYDGGYGGSDGYGGYGGYGGCEEYSYWQPTSASCSPAAVECEDAQDGDVCALPGDYCSWSYGECGYEDKYCTEDHQWSVEYWEDECCYDDCYECEGYACPETPPVAGDYCDPCYDAQECYYVTESPCGPLSTFASCNQYEYSWEVAEEVCEMPGEPEPAD